MKNLVDSSVDFMALGLDGQGMKMLCGGQSKKITAKGAKNSAKFAKKTFL
jgi:hypothetical protein